MKGRARDTKCPGYIGQSIQDKEKVTNSALIRGERGDRTLNVQPSEQVVLKAGRPALFYTGLTTLAGVVAGTATSRLVQ